MMKAWEAEEKRGKNKEKSDASAGYITGCDEEWP
jgi:hypothetical protein